MLANAVAGAVKYSRTSKRMLRSDCRKQSDRLSCERNRCYFNWSDRQTRFASAYLYMTA